jgi:hypothetical protein
MRRPHRRLFMRRRRYMHNLPSSLAGTAIVITTAAAIGLATIGIDIMVAVRGTAIIAAGIEQSTLDDWHGTKGHPA